MAPFHLETIAGTIGYDLIFLLIGMGFGAVLELSGFGDSRKLAAQFYLREMTVLKVMFTAIVVACVLVFLSSALGLLDFGRLWVNPTYLAPGIVGGLVMGVGFILGGFCPGTSLVAASTLKLDGIFFVLGVFAGVFLFGETVDAYQPFYHSTAMGRFTIPEWLGLPYGVVVLMLVLMALAMFWAAGVSEAFFGARKSWQEIRATPWKKGHLAGAGALVLLAGVTAAIGQPTLADRWGWIAADGQQQIALREIYVEPVEVVDLKKDLTLRVDVLDLRREEDFNRFHLAGARRVTREELRDPAFVKTLLAAGDNTIVFLASNGEEEATAAWKDLKAQGVVNLYVLAGGINGWLDLYPPPACIATRAAGDPSGDTMQWRFSAAVGDRIPSAHPDRATRDPLPACALEARREEAVHGAAGHDEETAPRTFVRKVRLQRKVVAKGGCG